MGIFSSLRTTPHLALVELWLSAVGDRVSKFGRMQSTREGREAADKALAADADMAYVFRKINEMGKEKAPEPIKIDDQPPPKPIRVAPEPQPSFTRPDPKPLEQTDQILAEILRMWPLLSERDRIELQGICQLKVYLNTKK